MSAEVELVPVRTEAELEAVLAEPLAVLYKHSPLCGLSSIAAREVRAFVDAHPAVPVHIVDVIRERSLSRDVARRLEVRHESPQAIVLKRGEVVWHGSHRSVTAAVLERETG